jgi:phage virion morphogenesis protein
MALRVDLRELGALAQRIEALADADTPSLLDAVGAEVESQTRRRIAEERQAPDGTPWAAWSPRYAATRHGGHSLLQAGGGLLDSIQYLVAAAAVEVGSNLVYAAIHQFGGAEAGKPQLPARPYLGLSPDNLADLGRLVDEWAAGQMEAR